MNTYGRLPVSFTHGRGLEIWDTHGKRYLDALAGIAVNTLGHAHPKLVPALQDQIAKMIHCCNYYHVQEQETLAKKLTELSGLTNVFFCSTGLEANEAAIKLARKFGHDKGISRPEIVVYEKAFHGRSIATLSATGNEKIQVGFGPLVEGFIRVPVNDEQALIEATQNNPNVVAVFMEAIQGEGGINSMHMDYLKAVRALCDQRDWLLMIDSDCWVVPSRERGQTDEIGPAGHQLWRMISEADRRGATIVGANVYRRGGEGLMTYKQSPTTGRLLTRGPRPDELGFPALGLEPVDAIGTSVFALNIAKLNLAHEFKFSDVSEDLHLCRSVREFHDDKPGCILVDDRVRTAHMGRPVPLAYDP